MSAVGPVLIPLLPPSRWAAPGIRIESARGVRIRFADGVDALCATSGLWNVPLGYGRPEIADAVALALRDASYLSVFRHSHPWVEAAAERLLALPAHPFRRALFTTSGGSANDAVMKLLRQRSGLIGQPQRHLVAGLVGSYHGLTFGAHALSGDELGQSVYGVDRRGVRHVPANDHAALEALLRREGSRLAGIVVEPVLGSGGVALSAEFIAALGEAREEHELLIVADEVATGLGRTGDLFASDRWPFAPDALILSKALTNGSAAAAVVLLGERLIEPFESRDAVFVHAETQAGTAASCAAILATLDLLDELRAGFERIEPLLAAGLTELAAMSNVCEVRRVGAMAALTVTGRSGAPIDAAGTAALVERIRTAGAVVHPGPAGIQFFPAAVMAEAELAELFGTVGPVLRTFDA